jgi:F420-dependent oxidoreductase-like protein
MKFGIHTGQQDASYDELRTLWKLADSSGFSWVSVWDHFYEVPYVDGSSPVFETIAIMTALAAETETVRVGCLVASAAFRSPAVLAKAATTVDHVSGGRATLGLGAGWHAKEYEAFGYEFPGPKERLDMLEESVQIVQGLLTQSRTTFEGSYYQVRDAQFNPKPVQAKLPVWIGGTGERRTIPMAARYADGWNAAYISANALARKSAVLDQSCERIGRDPRELERSVNLGFYIKVDAGEAERTKDEFYRVWSTMPRDRDTGMLFGTPDQLIDQIGRYVDTGVDLINIALRPPYDRDALQAFIEDVLPAFPDS